MCAVFIEHKQGWIVREGGTLVMVRYELPFIVNNGTYILQVLPSFTGGGNLGRREPSFRSSNSSFIVRDGA